jgi:hypothetical protein
MSLKPDLLTTVYPDVKLHPQFKYVRDSPLHESARAMLREVFADFSDPDGNFIEQFQTTGFDQRTFELYLFAIFKHEGFTIDRRHSRPDFLLNKNGVTICVEAVTANPASGPRPYSPVPQPRTSDERDDYLSSTSSPSDSAAHYSANSASDIGNFRMLRVSPSSSLSRISAGRDHLAMVIRSLPITFTGKGSAGITMTRAISSLHSNRLTRIASA